MDTRTIRESIEKKYGNLVTITEISKWSGRSRDWVRKNITDDLEYTTGGKSKVYEVHDVARAITRKKRKDRKKS